MLMSRDIFKYTFTALTTTTTVDLNKDDLSHARELLLELQVAAAATEVGDILACRLENTFDGSKYDTVVNFATVLGNDSMPQIRRANLQQFGDLMSTEEEHKTSGSTGGSQPTAGSVVNGPFPPVLRTAAGRQAAWRVVFTITDAGTVNASFTGTLKITAVSEV